MAQAMLCLFATPMINPFFPSSKPIRHLSLSSKMLKKSASFVLASLSDSTYEKQYASPLRLLRPRWTAFLNILRVFLF
jgi:hypothetical protein